MVSCHRSESSYTEDCFTIEYRQSVNGYQVKAEVNMEDDVLDYHENRAKGEVMASWTPFFFRDLDFDGIDELVIVHYSMAVRFHSGFDVYRIVDGKPVLIDYPPYKTYEDFGMTDYPEFDYKQMMITCPYPEGELHYIGRTIYGVSKKQKDTIVVNGRKHCFNHMEQVIEEKYI